MPNPTKPPKKESSSRKIWNTQRLVLLGMIVAIILSLFVFRKDIANAFHSQQAKNNVEEYDTGSRINFEPDSTNIFDVVGNRLAVLNSGTYRLYSLSGQEQIGTQYLSASPAMVTSDYGTVIFGRGEDSAVVVKPDAIAGSVSLSGGIVDACINDAGTLAVVHADERYRSVVSVYNTELELEYEWQTSEYYVLTAALSSDNRVLAAVALTQDDGVFITRVIFFMLDREEYYSYCDLTATMITKVSFYAGNILCAVGDDRTVLINTEGKITQEYDYSGNKLSTCAIDKDTCILAMIDQKSGLHSYLVRLTPDKDTLEVPCEDIRWVDVQDGYVAILYTDSVEMRDTDLKKLSEPVEVRNVRKVYAVSGGLTMMIYSSQAGAVNLIESFQK